jgi:DNA-binding transcriptional regulator PaaX
MVCTGPKPPKGKLGLIPSVRQLEIIKRSRSRLVARGLLVYQRNMLRLTTKGEQVLRRLELHNFKLRKPKRWDRKWRVLIFDIPERRKGLRQKVRNTLKTIGFLRLQNSVWAYPYDCEDLITLLKADFKIGKDLLYLIVDSLEYDRQLKERFGLEKQ